MKQSKAASEKEHNERKRETYRDRPGSHDKYSKRYKPCETGHVSKSVSSNDDHREKQIVEQLGKERTTKWHKSKGIIRS